MTELASPNHRLIPRTSLLAIVAILSVAPLVFAQEPAPKAGDTVGYYVVKPGDTLQGVTERFLGTPALWRENWKLNPDVENPDVLTPGQRIRIILSRELPAQEAEIRSVARRVEKKPAPQDWTAARKGDELREKDGVRTFTKSSAELGFQDGSSLVLTEDSLVFIAESRKTMRGIDRNAVELIQGQADLTSRKRQGRDSEIEIVIGDATATPRSGASSTAQARARKAGTAAQVMVFQGESDVEAAGQKVSVAQGMGTVVPEGQPPAPPEKLLPAPRLVGPVAGETVGRRARFSWTRLEPAAGYTVEVCLDADCTQLVDRVTNLTSPTVILTDLPHGDLYWRATAMSSNGLDGYPSGTRTFVVAPAITGIVAEDPDGRGHRNEFKGIASARVRLYRDAGDDLPSEDDVLVTSADTDADGGFVFQGLPNGVYWVRVDSRGLRSPRGGGQGELWPEQTWGPAGALCINDEWRPVSRSVPGPCYGGRSGASDDSGSIESAEHIARVVMGEGDTESVDFGFAFGLVTNAEDSPDASQGSLRRAIMNTNATPGPDSIRFVPASAPASGSPWWTLRVFRVLPDVVDELSIDGLALRASDGMTPRRSESIRTGSEASVGVSGRPLENPRRPDLIIDGSGHCCGIRGLARTEIRNLALRNAEWNIELHASGIVEDVVIGAWPDGSRTFGDVDRVGIAVLQDSKVAARRALIMGQSAVGLLVESISGKAVLDAESIEIVDSGFTATSAAILIRSSESTVRRSLVRELNAAGARSAIVIGGNSPYPITSRSNRIEESTIEALRTSVAILDGGEDNVVKGNVFARALDSAVVLSSVDPRVAPKRNRITGNEFIGIGSPRIDIEGCDPVRGNEADACSYDDSLPNRGVPHPVLSMRYRKDQLEVRGRAVPGSTVEIYVADRQDHARLLRSVEVGQDGSISFITNGDFENRSLLSLTIDSQGNTSELVLVDPVRRWGS